MKKIITLALVFVLALSLLTACGGNSGNGGGSTTTPPSNSSTTPPASQSGNDTTPSGGGDSSGWATEYGKVIGITGLTAYPDSTVNYSQGAEKVEFTAKSDISLDSAELEAYIKSLWDAAKASSPDGLYEFDGANSKKGAELTSFDDWYTAQTGTNYFYYTKGEYIAQLSYSVNGSVVKLQYNRPRNSTGELVTP